jgi:hypothetical protein
MPCVLLGQFAALPNHPGHALPGGDQRAMRPHYHLSEISILFQKSANQKSQCKGCFSHLTDRPSDHDDDAGYLVEVIDERAVRNNCHSIANNDVEPLQIHYYKAHQVVVSETLPISSDGGFIDTHYASPIYVRHLALLI